MFGFLVGKQNLIADDYGKQNSFYNKKLGTIDSEIQKKINKVAFFDPDNSFDSLGDSNVKLENNDKSSSGDPMISSLISREHDVKTQKTIETLKKFSFLLDVIVCILMVSCSIVGIIENQEFYNFNYNKRVFGILIINNINKNYSDTIQKDEFNNLFDQTDLEDFFNFNISDINGVNATNFDRIMKNSLIISNISQNFEEDFNIKTNSTNSSIVYDFSEINIPLDISNKSESLRFYLLIVIIISILINLTSRYLEYLKEFIYKRGEESK